MTEHITIWILTPGGLKETTGEDSIFYTYRFIAGSLKGCKGAVNKRLLSHVCRNGYQKIITNPLEAYAWECLINAEQ